jgi:hypothetical protein
MARSMSEHFSGGEVAFGHPEVSRRILPEVTAGKTLRQTSG